MRIVGGRLKGLRIQAPSNLPVRPTTDMAKEALFNILNNRFDFEQIKVLDLFSGTGSITLEFASRGTSDITSVDLSYHCVKFLKESVQQYKLANVKVIKADVFKYLNTETKAYDLIFADAPYDNPKLPSIPDLVFTKNLLNNSGLLIVEHPSTIRLNHYKQFTEQRKYGYSSFSFFENLDKSENTL
ncbi:methyltransferase domain-containing protein [Pedobacter sp. HMF7647]|uniref:Methyltransferase domain-containing protein n=1 Tax=Hufsiella arboris TaxID=2695275 RepID=A0A7K1Y7Q7_9SPHI|nr:RsmD family RNA methyltransferase [Hufsiella arboris]MXV50615.1 methyltransferase domain-containing protein [Hufsiella arboris]